MTEKNESENEREIIQVRRIIPKSKQAEKSNEDALKAKAAELKRRVFRTQLALGIGLAFFFFLGLRSLGCFQSNATPQRQPQPLQQTNELATLESDESGKTPAPFLLDASRPSVFPAFPDSEPQSASSQKTRSTSEESNAPPSVPINLRALRVATWNLNDFNFAKLSDFNVGGNVATLIQEFDVVALQGIRAKNRAVLDGLVYLIANNGGDYSYVASTPGRRDEILAIFFNAETVDVDRSSVSEIVDSRGRLATPSLVAAFRSAATDAKNSFTFLLINCDLTQNPNCDGAALVDVYRTLRKRAGALGVAEDDLLLVGDFGVSIQKIKELGEIPNFVAIHVDKKTDVDDGTSANVLFDSIATTEYVERFGVVNLADYFDISASEAAAIAKGRPLWADFSVSEGGDAQFSTSSSSRSVSETRSANDAFFLGDVPALFYNRRKIVSQ